MADMPGGSDVSASEGKALGAFALSDGSCCVESVRLTGDSRLSAGSAGGSVRAKPGANSPANNGSSSRTRLPGIGFLKRLITFPF